MERLHDGLTCHTAVSSMHASQCCYHAVASTDSQED